MAEEKGQEAALHEIVTALRESGSAVVSSLDSENAGLATDTDCGLPGAQCALCELGRRSVQRSMRAFFTEFVNDPQVRVQFRKSRGFCREHTTALAECGDALGVAILFADLVDETRSRWRSGIWGQKGFFSFWPNGNDELQCPACRAETDSDRRYVAALAQGLRVDPKLWDVIKAGAGVCVPHIERIGAACSQEDAARLFQIELEKLDGLFRELEEFVRKNDYRFRGEPWGTERDAWRRALLRLRKR